MRHPLRCTCSGILMVIVQVFVTQSHAETVELRCTVRSVNEASVTLGCDGGATPRAGDEVTLGFEVPGVGFVALEGSRSLFLIAGLLAVACKPMAPPPSTGKALVILLHETTQSQAFERGVAMHIDSPLLGLDWQGTTGIADPENGELMTPLHPVRIANNTKTYIAAAVLRLFSIQLPHSW